MTFSRINHARAARLIAACMLPGALLVAASAWAAEPRGQVEVQGEIVTVGDLFSDAGEASSQAVFYAPSPGQSVEIGPNFLHRVALGFDLDWNPGAGMARVIVTRAAVPVGTDAMAPVVLAAIAERVGGSFDLERTNVAFDAGIATHYLPVGIDAGLSARDIAYDPRSQRFSAVIDIASGTAHATSVRASGRLRSVVLAPVLVRAIGRDELIGPQDVQWMEVEASRLGSNVLFDADRLIGYVARRALAPNQPIAEVDVQAPLAVRRGETVTMVLQSGSISLTAQARALQDGSRGDTIRVVNTHSSITLEAIVEAPGVVRVTAPGAAH
ncbi:MAG: flagellar basal body P-ring formation chaperone FlgA [Alphaproteobacteria bacterium]